MISSPAKRTRPPSGLSAPAMQLKQVVLPAPFGPIRPVIEPRATSNVAPSTAMWPPKRLTRPETSSSTSTRVVP